MKVVINSSYGGFGLSEEAFEMLLARKGISFEKEYSGCKVLGCHYYEPGQVGNNAYYISQRRFYEDRADPDLVTVVEELKDRANTKYANIKVVQIPDDVKWHISEYDGSEWVAEDHRTWD